MYCKYCGARLPEDAAYCPGCGVRLRQIAKRLVLHLKEELMSTRDALRETRFPVGLDEKTLCQ